MRAVVVTLDVGGELEAQLFEQFVAQV